jgi:hypothetical protein
MGNQQAPLTFVVRDESALLKGEVYELYAACLELSTRSRA